MDKKLSYKPQVGSNPWAILISMHVFYTNKDKAYASR